MSATPMFCVQSFAGIAGMKPRPPKNDSYKSPRPPVPKLSFKSIYNDENEQNQMNCSPRAKPKSVRSSNPRFSHAVPASSRTNLSQSPVIADAPITPEEAKLRYSAYLNSYEMEEINQFPDIYYLGNPSKKIVPKASSANNHNFDDDSFHYKTVVGDHIAYRFEVRAAFGKGAFGQVLRVLDHKTNKQVALKIIINTQQMHEQGRIEVHIIQTLNEADKDNSSCIVSNMDSFVFRNHICATFEVMGPNLYEFSRSIKFRPMGIRQLKSLAKQMLTALSFCHSHNIIHCDMKPENVLFCMGSTLNCKVIDFGSSCFVGQQRYEYIQSRFYRAPEVILGIVYGPPMDVWSFACILVELLIGRPLFPGENEQEQLEMIMEVLGAPPMSLVSICKRKSEYFDLTGRPLLKNRLKKRRIPGSISLKEMTRIGDPMLIDLIEKCLAWDQGQRITAESALKHTWFTAKKIKAAKSARGPSKHLPELFHL